MLLFSEAPLAKSLLLDWSKGDTSARKVQKTANDSCRQEGDHASYTMLALRGIGKRGLQPHHCDRDLKRLKLSPTDALSVPEPYEFKVNQKKKKDEGIEEVTHYMVLPSDWLGKLHENKSVFDKLILGDPGERETFWEHEAEWPDCHRHHIQDTAQCVPIGLHGDDAGVYLKEKLLVLQMHSLLANDDNMFQKLLITVMTYSLAIGGVTMNMILNVLKWSLASCYFGIHPPHDHLLQEWEPGTVQHRLGQARAYIANGWCLIWNHIEGDWKFHKEFWSIRHYGMLLICHWCNACKRGSEDMVYTNIRDDAGWRRTYITTAEHLAGLRDDRTHNPMYGLPNFSLWRIFIDSMHSLELGMVQIIWGSLLTDLCMQGCYGEGSMKERLERVHHRYLQHCDTHNTTARCEKFTVELGFIIDWLSWFSYMYLHIFDFVLYIYISGMLNILPGSRSSLTPPRSSRKTTVMRMYVRTQQSIWGRGGGGCRLPYLLTILMVLIPSKLVVHSLAWRSASAAGS